MNLQYKVINLAIKKFKKTLSVKICILKMIQKVIHRFNYHSRNFGSQP